MGQLDKCRSSIDSNNVNRTGMRRFHRGRAHILTARRPTSLVLPTTNDEADNEAEDDDAADDGYRDEVQTTVETHTVVSRRQRGGGQLVLSATMKSSGHCCQPTSKLQRHFVLKSHSQKRHHIHHRYCILNINYTRFPAKTAVQKRAQQSVTLGKYM